jgi:hypothetical protein
MSTNARLLPATTSLSERIRISLKHTWETIQPGPRAWQGAARGLLVVAISFMLIASYTVFLA